MTERSPEARIEEDESRTLEEIAFREGDPSEWGRFERTFDIVSRVCDELGLEYRTEEIMQVAGVESERQEKLFLAYERTQRQLAADSEYRSKMGAVATGLVDALVPPDDPRNRDEVTDAVLAALRPLHERLTHAEWDGVARH